MKRYTRYSEVAIEDAKLQWCNDRNTKTLQQKKGLGLEFNEIVKFEDNRRDTIDNRKKVDKIVISYFDKNKDEYRVSFIFPPNMGESNIVKLIPKTIN
jgi:hypothetical protein